MKCAGLKKYSNVFGRPGEGAHKWRVGARGIYKHGPTGVAIFDLVGTVVLAALLTFTLKSSSFILIFCVLMAVAFAAHVAFGVPTTLTTLLVDIQPCDD